MLADESTHHPSDAPADPAGSRRRSLFGAIAVAHGIAVSGCSIAATPAVQITAGYGPRAVAAGFGAVWVIDTLYLMKVDPTTDAVTKTVQLETPDQGEIYDIAVGGGAIWVAAQLDGANPKSSSGTVLRIDPATMAITATVRVGDSSMSVGDSSPSIVSSPMGVWVADESSYSGGSVSRIDPTTNAAAAAIDVSPLVSRRIAYGDGSVWVVGRGAVARIDAATGKLVRTIPVSEGSWSVAVGPGAVWITNGPNGTATQTD